MFDNYDENSDNSYEDYRQLAEENAYFDSMYVQYTPKYRANELVDRIALLLELSAGDLPKEKCKNSFGISPQGYKLAYSVCGFFVHR